jgi:hypothetical protein
MTSDSIDVRWTAMVSGARVDLERSRAGMSNQHLGRVTLFVPGSESRGGAESSACRVLSTNIQQLSGLSHERIGDAGMRHFLRVIDRSCVYRCRYLAPSRKSRHPEPVMMRPRDVARYGRLVSGSRPPVRPPGKIARLFIGRAPTVAGMSTDITTPRRDRFLHAQA